MQIGASVDAIIPITLSFKQGYYVGSESLVFRMIVSVSNLYTSVICKIRLWTKHAINGLNMILNLVVTK
jgi:hypothetical protein